jgi:hypothetical protein
LNDHARREAKKALSDILLTSLSGNKEKASALVADILNLADPKRPVKQGAIRQIYYGR